MLEDLLHVDALRVEDHLLGAILVGDLVEQAARDAPHLHDDGRLRLSHQQRRQVKVHVADGEDDGCLGNRRIVFS